MRCRFSATAPNDGLSVLFTASINATPLRRDASIMRRASRAFAAIGFSHSTCLPRFMQRMELSAWVELGVAM